MFRIIALLLSFGVLYSNYGISLAFLYYLGVCTLFIEIALLDFKEKVVHDGMIFLGVIWALGFSSYFGQTVFAIKGLLAALLVSLLIYGIGFIISKLIGQEAFGAGDVTFIVLIGCVAGIQGLIIIIYFSIYLGCFIALILKTIYKMPDNGEIPFAPILAIGCAIYAVLPWQYLISMIKVVGL